MAMSKKAVLDAATEVGEIMEKLPAKAGVKEFERLLEKSVGKFKDDADRVMDQILANLGKPKPKAPSPSVPTPKLRREPAPKPQPKTEPKTGAQLDPSRAKKTGTETKEKGILTLQSAVQAVRAILASGQSKALGYASMIPFVGTAIGVTELVRGVPDDEAIIRLMRQAILFQKNKRKREKLEVAGKVVMRRLRGAGYDRLKDSVFGAPQKPLPSPQEPPRVKKKSDSDPLLP